MSIATKLERISNILKTGVKQNGRAVEDILDEIGDKLENGNTIGYAILVEGLTKSEHGIKYIAELSNDTGKLKLMPDPYMNVPAFGNHLSNIGCFDDTDASIPSLGDVYLIDLDNRPIFYKCTSCKVVDTNHQYMFILDFGNPFINPGAGFDLNKTIVIAFTININDHDEDYGEVVIINRSEDE